jgi:hypothetical protein
MLKDEYGNAYWPLYNVDLIGQMQAGKGYQVKCSEPEILVYPAN